MATIKGELLGRESEIAEGDRFLGDVLAAQGRGLLILGEPGIGKTALAGAVAERAQGRDLKALWGRASELVGAPPLWIWAPILRDLMGLQHGGADARTTTVLRHLGELAVGSSSPEIGDRFEIFDAVARAAEVASRTKGLLLVLDDLQWADEVSWELAISLGRSLSGTRVGLVITCREDEAARTEAKATLLNSLSRECTVIYPPLLEAADAEKMFAAKSDRALRPEEVDQLLRATGGNPLLIQELARLASQKNSSVSDLVTHRSGRITRQRIAERVRSLLGGAATELVEYVSVLGSGGDESVLRELISPDVMAQAKVTVDAGVLALNPDRSLTFAHDMMRAAIYETIPTARRASLHARCAEVLQNKAAVDKKVVYEVATHLLHAGSDQHDAAAEFCLAAGLHALERFAPELGLVYLDEGSKRVPPENGVMKCDMQIARIRALVRSGRRNEASDLLLSAAEIARELDDASRLADALIAYGESFYRAGVPIEIELGGLLEEALERLPRDAMAQRAILLADLAARKNFGQGRDGREEAQEAVALAREAEDDTALARALMSAAYTSGPDRIEEAVSAMDELVEIGRRRRNSDLVVIGCSCRAAFHLETRSIGAFEEDLERVSGIAERTRATMHLWSSLTLQACLAFIRGELAESAKISQEALSLAPSHPGALTAWFLDLWLRNEFANVEADPFELFEAIRGQARWTRQLRAPRCGWVHMLAKAGRIEDARIELRMLLDEVDTWPKDMLWLVSLGWLAKAAADTGSREECSRLYELLIPYEERVLYTHVGLPTGYMGTVAAILGSLQEVLGDPERSLRFFEVAGSIQASVGDRGCIAKLKLEHAVVLAAVGQTIEAQRLASEAQSLAAEKSLSKIKTGAATFLRTLGTGGGALELRFERGGWSLGEVRLKDMRGLRYIAELVRRPDEQIHVLELSAGPGRAPRKHPQDGALSVSTDVTAPVLDTEAKDAYRRRVRELQSELDEAEVHNDPARAARFRAEIDLITGELEAAIGLGGRDRKLGSESEKARIAVTKAIRFALDRVCQEDGELGEYLKATVRTGTFCAYEPRPSLPGYREIVVR